VIRTENKGIMEKMYGREDGKNKEDLVRHDLQ